MKFFETSKIVMSDTSTSGVGSVLWIPPSLDGSSKGESLIVLSVIDKQALKVARAWSFYGMKLRFKLWVRLEWTLLKLRIGL